MTRRLKAKFKIDRRYGTNLWGREKSPVNKRTTKPGKAGGASAQVKPGGKQSPHGEQLAAKQQLRGFYGLIPERQFRRFYKEASRLSGNTGENFVGLLERRLDAVVYHMKFVPTIFAARQFVNHGHVRVNGKRVNIPSYLVCEGDTIELKTGSQNLTMVLESSKLPERDVPGYLQVDPKKCKGQFLRTPKLADIPYPSEMNLGLVVEWYARRI